MDSTPSPCSWDSKLLPFVLGWGVSSPFFRHSDFWPLVVQIWRWFLLSLGFWVASTCIWGFVFHDIVSRVSEFHACVLGLQSPSLHFWCFKFHPLIQVLSCTIPLFKRFQVFSLVLGRRVWSPFSQGYEFHPLFLELSYIFFLSRLRVPSLVLVLLCSKTLFSRYQIPSHCSQHSEFYPFFLGFWVTSPCSLGSKVLSFFLGFQVASPFAWGLVFYYIALGFLNSMPLL